MVFFLMKLTCWCEKSIRTNKQKIKITGNYNKYSLEKEMATHSSVLAWKTPWAEKPGGLQSWGHKRVGYDLVTTTRTIVKYKRKQRMG